MKKRIFLAILLLSACSEAREKKPDQCAYTDNDVVPRIQKNNLISTYTSERIAAQKGGEHILRESLTLANGDEVLIEQSYCYMYNYNITYRLSGETGPASLVQNLATFDDLISKAIASKFLNQRVSEIILESLSMPQKMLSEEFLIGLPSRFTSSKENVEYSFGYKPIVNHKKFSAEFHLYIGVGGL